MPPHENESPTPRGVLALATGSQRWPRSAVYIAGAHTRRCSYTHTSPHAYVTRHAYPPLTAPPPVRAVPRMTALRREVDDQQVVPCFPWSQRDRFQAYLAAPKRRSASALSSRWFAMIPRAALRSRRLALYFLSAFCADCKSTSDSDLQNS